MSFWVLLQILVNLILFAGLGVLWVKLSRPAKDDPRLSKGLQLLQSKIAVLEDLSDRTETQVSQLTAILETKCRELQEKIAQSDKQIAKIEASSQKSLEVAKIFQDRIPHSEILERQNTIKYVKAALMAHQGSSVEEILEHVDMSRAEIEFIAKVNRDQLQFSEADLPEWAREAIPARGATPAAATPTTNTGIQYSLPRENFSSAPIAETPAARPSAVNPVVGNGQRFFEIDLGAGETPAPTPAITPAATVKATTNIASSQTNVVQHTMTAQTSTGKTVEVRSVTFPRIEKER